MSPIRHLPGADHGVVDEFPGLLPETVIGNVFHYSHNGEPEGGGIVPGRTQPFAKRALWRAGPEAVRHDLVDDDVREPLLMIRAVQSASGDQAASASSENSPEPRTCYQSMGGSSSGLNGISSAWTAVPLPPPDSGA